MTQPIDNSLEQIEQALDAGTYVPGPWQKFLGAAAKLEGDKRVQLSEDITRVSDKLHKRNGFMQMPVWLGFSAELLILVTSLMLMDEESIMLRLGAIVLLALCLQPLLKIAMGLTVGVRYSYVYLWYVEPRFKMRFGTYFALAKWRKLIFQFAGSLGTPIALYVGWQVLEDQPLLALACLLGSIGAALMQVGAFVAVLMGVRKVGPFLLTNLTTPATLAKELKGSD